MVIENIFASPIEFNCIQAALVIRGFDIRGFDYSQKKKLQITRENCHF